jgi:hypothetical protein
MHGTFNLLNERIDFHGVLKTDAEFSKVEVAESSPSS